MGPESTPSSRGSPILLAKLPYAFLSRARISSYTLLCSTSLLVVVQRCPAVPTHANTAARTTMSTSALSSTRIALLPPSSRMVLPKRFWTSTPTVRPTSVLPVKDSSGMRGSAPMAAPPQHRDATAPGMLLRSRTEETTLVAATDTRGVEGAPFQMVTSPQIMEMAEFQPNTAMGKLKAEMMPTTPRGLYISMRTCPGRSEGKTLPPTTLESPTA